MYFEYMYMYVLNYSGTCVIIVLLTYCICHAIYAVTIVTCESMYMQYFAHVHVVNCKISAYTSIHII